MKKTVNVNVGGFALIMEDSACATLLAYMDQLEECYRADDNAKEILSDIECRIGELLTEFRGGAEVVTDQMVNVAIKRVGDPGQLNEDQEESKACNDDQRPYADLPKKRLYRDVESQNIGGVCAGLASYFGLDVAIFRIVWTALLVGGMFLWDGRVAGFAVMSYVVLWLCIPAARTVHQKCAMKGEPVNLDQFRKYTPQDNPPVKARRSPVLAFLAAVAGLFLMVVGLPCAISGVCMPFGPRFLDNSNLIAEIHLNGMEPEAVSFITDGILLNPVFWSIAALISVCLGVLLCYWGLCLVLNLKSPKWHPALVMFIVLIVACTAMAAHVISEIAHFGLFNF